MDSLIPANFTPGLVYVLADHRAAQPILVVHIAEGKAAFNATVALVGLPVLVRDHADDVVTAQVGAERTAYAAIGAGGYHRVLGLPLADNGFFRKICACNPYLEKDHFRKFTALSVRCIKDE